jgi:S1-C subfamily serine protease
VVDLTADTPAAAGGLRQGDIVTAMNGRAVATMVDYFRELNDRSVRTVRFTVTRAGAQVNIGLAR